MGWVLVLGVVVAAGCSRKLNPEFCLAHPDDVRCGSGIDAPTACTTSADCPGQICDTTLASPQCADCSADDTSLCPATAPVCSVDDTCQACVTDDDCVAGVCLPDGSCPAEDRIIHASNSGVGTAGCGAIDMPCTLVQAVVEVDADRDIIKVAPDAAQDYVIAGNSGLNVDKNVVIDARGATIRKTSTGPAITIGNGNTVTVLGGAVTGGLGSGGDGITCTSGVLTVIGTDIGGNQSDGIGDTGCGLVVDGAVLHNNSAFGINKSTGALSLTRSTLRSNLGGGASVINNGTRFTIVGNVFWSNGTVASGFGGVQINTDTSTQSRLEFNTFNSNLDNGGAGAAVSCIVAGFVARNNVMFENGTLEQVSGTCTHVYTLSSPGTPLTGTGDITDDPMFVDATAGELHTLPGSPTEGAADPSADLSGVAAEDLDGDVRTAPADLGADEHP